MHLKNIFKEWELDKDSTVKKILTFQNEENREVKREYYNLDAIIAVGYRINSKKATEFRIWATKVLKEYMIKGEYPTKSEVEIAKNYLKEEELDKLNRMVSAYLDVLNKDISELHS